MDKLLEFKNVTLGYGGKAVLPPVNLHLGKGEFLGVVGPNGAGKTTLLKAILGILSPLAGKVTRDKNLRFGYVPQRQIPDELYPLSVKEIVEMSRYPFLKPWQRAKGHHQERVKKALSQAGITDLAGVAFRELSGGQKQRTLLARALAADPQVLVLDEPTNGMDIRAEHAIMEIVEQLNREGLSVIMVTHLLNLVANRAGTLLLLNDQVVWGKADQVLTGQVLSQTYKGSVQVNINENGEKMIYTN